MVLILPVFPDGRLAARAVARGSPARRRGLSPGRVGFALGPAHSYFRRRANPFGVDHAGPIRRSASPVGGCSRRWPVGARGSLVLRLRRARGVERQQLKWFALAACSDRPCCSGRHRAVDQRYPVVAVVVALFNALPIAAGVAILRYRLYDIDLVINRTLVYGALTATLVAAYLVLGAAAPGRCCAR